MHAHSARRAEFAARAPGSAGTARGSEHGLPANRRLLEQRAEPLRARCVHPTASRSTTRRRWYTHARASLQPGPCAPSQRQRERRESASQIPPFPPGLGVVPHRRPRAPRGASQGRDTLDSGHRAVYLNACACQGRNGALRWPQRVGGGRTAGWAHAKISTLGADFEALPCARAPPRATFR